MVKKLGPDEPSVILKFGGGLHTRASADEIDGREAASGHNFLIDIQNRNLQNRPPFDLVGTVPNASEIRGGGSLVKQDGTVATFFQAGSTVYSWDGLTTFTSIGTVNSSSKLRGHWRSHNWTLSNKVLITDLNVADVIKEWDGSTFQSSTFTTDGTTSFGTFYAKYLNISNERAIFSNVKDGSGALPHMIVGSKQSDYTQISSANQPSSSLGKSDPWFLLTPDLRPVNGHVEAFGAAMVSTEKGMIFNLTGTDSTNYAFSPFYPGSAAVGAESTAVIGNDIIYGRQGRIESVRDTNTFGNSQSDDVTSIVSDKVESYNGWTIVFNSRLRKAYCFPNGVSECWVLDAAMRDQAYNILKANSALSPWMLWTTQHEMGFQPTFVMSMLDPQDGLEYVFMGDSSGNIYRMEGTGANGDGGTSTIDLQFLSKLLSAKLDEQVYNVEGYIKYAKNESATVTLTFQYQGKELFDKSITLSLPQVSASAYYGGGAYYGGDFYYGTVAGRIARQTFHPPGSANEFQVLVEVTGNNDISINEIGLRFKAATN